LQIATTRFGALEIQEEQIIHMPSGIIGFPDQRKYVLLEQKKGSPFLWLQSVDNGALAFVLINPLLFKPDYKVEMGREDAEDLGLKNGGNGAQIMAIVNILNRGEDGKPTAITANLLGPIVINPQKRLAKQIVLYDGKYSHRHPIPLTKN
jgi:flagellar assembly factor FliW